MQNKRWIYFLAVLFILDVGYSFIQHYHISLDGDLPNIILPAEEYQPLMDDPLGLGVLIEGKTYSSPNRYFAHWFTQKYFQTIPIFLQNFISPINSVYFSCALIKTVIQVFLILLLSVFITGKFKIFSFENLVAIALITPLFHVTGYYQYMGAIDHATTYTLFYAFPLSLVLLFFLPFYQKLFFRKKAKFSKAQIIFLFFLSIYLALNGPLVPGLVLLILGMIGLYQIQEGWFNQKINFISDFVVFIKNKISISGIFLLSFFGLICLYSFYIGQHTVEGSNTLIPLSERYLRLPEGVLRIFTQKLGFPILIGMITLNIFLIKKQSQTEGSKRLLNFLKWIGIFALVYILLLPLGGYREYRPNIIRRDTFLPITLSIFYVYGMTSFYLFKNIVTKYRKWYIGGLILIAMNFTIVDKPDYDNNTCERDALEKISKSNENIVKLENDCLIMTWVKVKDPAFTETNSQVLQLWNITETPKLYFQETVED